MKQFRVTGVDRNTNKPLQTTVQAPDQAQAYMAARKLFSSIERIEPILTAPATPHRIGQGGPDGKDGEPDIDLDEEEDDDIPDLSDFDPAGPRVGSSFRTLLRIYQGQIVGVNFSEPDKFGLAKLVAVNQEYFTIRISDNLLTFHFAIRGIVSAAETAPGSPGPGKVSQAPGLYIELPTTSIHRAMLKTAAKN